MSAKIILVGIIILLCLASYYDIRFRIIPNLTSICIIILGLLYHVMHNNMQGLKVSLVGMSIGFLFFLLLYILKMMGAGDVKLGTAVGSILGIKVIPAIVIIIFIGGLIALVQIIIFLIKERINPKNLNNQFNNRTFSDKVFKQSVPYGVAISMGTIFALILY